MVAWSRRRQSQRRDSIARFPGTAAGNALITIPVLLILLAAMALVLANSRPAGPDSPSRPAAPAD